jgi:hypothetical protein
VLTAFEQVEDYLAAVRILSNQLQQQQAATDSAQRFVDLETARYQTGIDPYIDLVTAQETLLSDRQTLANLHTQEMTASVSLIEALGGGWDSTQLPTPAQVSLKLTPHRPPLRSKRDRHCGGRKPAGKCRPPQPARRNGCVQRWKPAGAMRLARLFAN